MDWLIAHAAHMEVVFGAAMAAWAFFARLDKSYRQHLKEELASKTDLAHVAHKIDRLESKLDDILLDGFRRSQGGRRAKPRVKKRARTTA